MAIITLFRNPFSDVYSQFHCKNNITIQKAAKIDLENSLIFVNGKESTPDHILTENDICQIRILPSGSTVDVVAGVLTGGLYTAADAITYGITGSHISEHFYRGLRDLLLPDVDVETTNERTSLKSIPQLKGAKNQSGLNKPVPLVLGKHLFTPYYCGQPYTSIDSTDGSDGENLYFHALYMIGYSNVLVSDIKIGELELAGNSLKTLNGTIPVDPTSVYADHGVELEIQQSEEVSLFPVKVIEEQLSIELKNVDGIQRKPVRFSANNPKTVELEVTLNGLVGYSTTGAKQNRTVQICAQWKPHGGDTWYDFPQFINSNSYSSGVSTFTRQKNSQMRFVSRKTFDYSEIIDVESGIVDIRIFRTNPAGTDGRTTDGAFWTAIRTTCFDRAASINSSALIDQKPVDEEIRNKTCRLGFKIKAGEDVEGTIDEINMIVESIARTWNGSSWTSMLTAISNVTTSNNTASVALLALEQSHLGKESVSPSKIDYDGFGELYEFCEAKGYTCNGVLTTTQKEDDLIDKILSTSRSQKTTKDGKYSPLIDNERLYPITIINQQNTISCSNTKEFNVLPDGLRLTFIDEADGYQKNELRVLYDGKSVDDPDLVYEDLELPWVTNRDHAWKLGRYILAVKKLRPEVWTRKVGIDGRAIPIGSRVLVQDDTIAIGLNSGGEIKQILTSGDNINGIVCDSHFEMIDGKTYGIRIVQADGSNEPTIRTVQLVTTPGWTTTLMFAAEILPTEEVLPSEGDFIAFGEYTSITVDALVLGRTPSGDEEWELSLVEYNEDIYNADTGTIPPFDSKISIPKNEAPNESQDSYATIEDVATAIQAVSESGDDEWIPNTIEIVHANAKMDQIDIEWVWNGAGIRNNIKVFRIELSKNNGLSWTEVGQSRSNIVAYHFDRDTDGYPAADDLTDWRIRVRAENIYGKIGAYGPTDAGQTIDASMYVGWTPATPSISTRVNGRGVSIGWNFASTWYGQGDVDVQIAKGYTVDEDGELVLITDTSTLEAYAPATGVDPTESYENYKEGTLSGFLTRGGNAFFVALPLYGQNEEPASTRDTPYYIRVRSISEQPTTAEPNGRVASDWGSWNLVYAHASGAQDVVRAWKLNDLGEKVRIDGSLGAEHIYANLLSAISANLGVITDGALEGNENNMWALSRIYEDDGITVKHYEGTVRMGGDDQYLHVTPIVQTGVVTGYNIDFKVGNFTVTAIGSIVNGQFEVRNLRGDTVYFSIDPSKNGLAKFNGQVVVGPYTSPTELMNIHEVQGVGEINFTGTGVNDLEVVSVGDSNGEFEVEILSDGDENTWENVVEFSSPVNAIAVNGDICLAGLHTGNIYKSTDKGETWALKWGGSGISENCIVYHNGVFLAGRSSDLLKSTNNGDTWVTVLSVSGVVKCIAVSDDYYLVGVSDGSVYKSIDSGETWSLVHTVTPAPYSLLIKDSYALLGTYDARVYKSVDSGETWSLKQDLGEYYVSPFVAGDGFIIACSIGTNSEGWLYKSTDDGETWVLKKNLGSSGYAKNIFRLGNNYIAVLGIVAPYPNAYISYDNGETWTVYSYFDSLRGIRDIHIGSDYGLCGGSSEHVYKMEFSSARWRETTEDIWSDPIVIGPNHSNELTGYGTIIGFAEQVGHVVGDTWVFEQTSMGALSIKDKDGVEYFSAKNGVVTIGGELTGKSNTISGTHFVVEANRMITLQSDDLLNSIGGLAVGDVFNCTTGLFFNTTSTASTVLYFYLPTAGRYHIIMNLHRNQENQSSTFNFSNYQLYQTAKFNEPAGFFGRWLDYTAGSLATFSILNDFGRRIYFIGEITFIRIE